MLPCVPRTCCKRVAVCSQDVHGENFSLMEVLLDKGVTERRVERSDKPWVVMQHSRKVGTSPRLSPLVAL